MFVIDCTQKHFGGDECELLHSVDIDDVKGFPCAVSKDSVLYGVKVIPLQTEYPLDDKHPALMEARVLKELTQSKCTPHITRYISDHVVKNSSKALTCFPLKFLKNVIYHKCQVLQSEFIENGSLEDNHHEIGEAEWRYIIFAVVWSLYVLQEKYKFIHYDLHYGNILLDTTDSKGITYTHGDFRFFCDPPGGLMPKLWDFEFTELHSLGWKNPFNQRLDGVAPVGQFDPRLDLHFFINSLGELSDMPQVIQDFVFSLYPSEEADLLDDNDSGDDAFSEVSSCSGSSQCSQCSSCGVTNAYLYHGHIRKEALDLFGDIMWTPEQLLRHSFFDIYRLP
ncbi:uncharacterized protein BJ171DRAFT_495867 [Polychytrium aggregatum]|uniref:uncharacterized protein n=1 Tax=Polychytrium aggregatum TaxID=110093 RepID=UPI0022FE2CFD|nr:uncharacterized protein BJ171DRAFT_495867 [Polychytrium aggregatum]KAI9206569.1 hypothetical protein BJ171DRAFT_495867 [Polychytrium aggregatum]